MGPWGEAQACEAGVLRNARSCLPIACVRPSRCGLLPGGKPVLGLGPHSGGWWWCALGHLPIFPWGPHSQTGPTSQSLGAALGAQGQSVRQDPTLLPTVIWKLGFAQAQRKVSADPRPTWQPRCSHWRTGLRKELLHL